MAANIISVHNLPFHSSLLAIELEKVSFFHFASVLFCKFGISVFKPLKKTDNLYPFKELFIEIEVSECQFSHMNNRFVEFARYYICKKNGYDVGEDSYHRVNGVVPNIAHILIDLM